MRKLVTFFIFVSCLQTAARADHITGGEMSYTYSGSSAGEELYRCTLKLYMRCNSGRVFNNPTIISVFRQTDQSRVMDLNVVLARTEIISLTNPDPCISNPPTVCYEVGYYEFSLTLPASIDGYLVVGQVNFRIAGISNLSNGYSQIGASYTMQIPGTYFNQTNVKNNSAYFTGSDLVIVCANNPFTYSFGAKDADSDDLQYSFCEAYKSSSGPSSGGNNASTPMSPPYQSVPYGNGFSGLNPLGSKVSIDSKTGLISGIAPGAGVYVVTVCVAEIRDGKVIATQRKDLQIAITSCSLTAAVLQPEYQLCKDTKTIFLSNLSISTLINSYYWELKDFTGQVIYTANNPTVTYSFPDTGIYYIKLVINRGQRCTDSTLSLARVYPGFKPAFSFQGICFTKPTNFYDASSSVYGTVNYWHWQFGAFNSNADTTDIRNPVYTFRDNGSNATSEIVGDTKGCRDTLQKPIEIFVKPPIDLSFRDTLICPPDQLKLQAFGRGIFTWSPSNQLISSTSTTADVAPVKTTTYYVDLNDDGCFNRDSVQVRVTDKVSLTAMNDTTICAGDAVRLRVQSNGQFFTWTPAAQLDNTTLMSPLATSFNTTTYTVTAGISKCITNQNIVVRTVPYPGVDAGLDTLICFATSARLNGSSDGNKFTWSPAAMVSNSSILNPVVSPKSTAIFVLAVSDNKGCPKQVFDSVTVIVLPDIEAYAGRDTSLVLGELLQLQAEGGTAYLWQPPVGLSATNIASPIANFDESIESIRYKVLVYNQAGCTDSAFITIKVFGTRPTVFVPTGFTPNGDGKNDLLRPIAVGIKSINRFSVFNRYGQLVFSTTTNGKGWDGRVNGQLQQTSSFVWLVEAVDFIGNVYKQKGISTLIR